MTTDNLSGLPHPVEALHEGDVQTALRSYAVREMFDYPRSRRGHSDVWICGFGMCLWLLDDRIGAASIWKKATTDAIKGRFAYSSTGTYQSGLLLWFAGAMLDNEEMRSKADVLFSRLASKKRQLMGGEQSALLVKLLRGDESVERILEIYRNDHPYYGEDPPAIHLGFRRIASFYAGLRVIVAGRTDEALQLWESAPPAESHSMALENYLLEHEKLALKHSNDQ